MGPLDVVLAKAAFCEALERAWSERSAPERVQKILRCADERDLEAAYKELGLEMMGRGRRTGANEFVEIWRVAGSGAAGARVEEDEDAVVKNGLASGLAKGIGKAFARTVNRRQAHLPRGQQTKAWAHQRTGSVVRRPKVA